MGSVLGLLIVGTALLLARQSGTPALDSMWAEDGALFLESAVRGNIPASFMGPYAGYLHTLPRLLGALASMAPITLASAILSGGAALVVTLLCGYVFLAARKMFRELWPAVLLAVLMLLLPTAGWETMNNATNLQWYLLFPCYFALVTPTPTRLAVLAGGIVVLATTLSTPAAVAFVPIAVWKLLARDSDAPSRWVPALLLAGLAVQVPVALFAETWPIEETRPEALLGLYGLRVAGALVVGQRFLPGAWDGVRWVFAFGALVAAGAVVAFGVRRSPARVQVWAPLVLSVVLFAGPVLLRGTSLLDPDADTLMVAGSRWAASPILLLATSLFLAIEALLARASRRRVAMSWIGISLLLGFTVLTSYEVRNLRSEAPRWQLSVRSAAAECDAGNAGYVRIPLSPPGWTTMLPCRSLE